MSFSFDLLRPQIGAVLLMGALSGGLSFGAEGRVLTQVAEIRALSREEAKEALPVRVRCVVTWRSAVAQHEFIVDDGVRGIYVAYRLPVKLVALKEGDAPESVTEPGALVEIEGISDPGGYAPVIVPTLVRRIGSAPLPAPRQVPLERLLSGAEDSQRVEVEGVAQAVSAVDKDGRATMSLMVSGHRCRVRFERGHEISPASVVDARVRVRGVFAPMVNARAEVVGLKISSTGSHDLEVIVPPPSDPFLAPRVRLSSLLPFSPDQAPYHRRVVRGVVNFAKLGEFFFLQEGNVGVRVASDALDVKTGEHVEVAGFVETTHTLASLSGSVVRSLGHGTLPVPLLANVNQILSPRARYIAGRPDSDDYSGRLVRLRGELLRIERDEAGHTSRLLMETEGQIFSVFPAGGGSSWSASSGDWVAGAELELTGVCELAFSDSPLGVLQIRPASFHLWLRTPDDVRVLHRPSWWTAERLRLALVWAGVIIALAAAWIVLLRWLLHRRSERLEQVMRNHRDVELEYASAQRERMRLAVDLHDGIKQHLSAASLRVEAAAGHLPASPATAAAHLESAYGTLLRTQTELEECLWGLRAVAEGPPDFVHLLHHVSSRAAHWPRGAVLIESKGTPRHLTRDVAGSLLLLFQEATGNAFRHGQASIVVVTVSYGADALELRIVDDGMGFDPRQVPGPRAGHFGIDGMRQRMHWLRGTLHITRHATSGGMEVIARLPWAAMQEATDLNQQFAENDTKQDTDE